MECRRLHQPRCVSNSVIRCDDFPTWMAELPIPTCHHRYYGATTRIFRRYSSTYSKHMCNYGQSVVLYNDHRDICRLADCSVNLLDRTRVLREEGGELLS